MKEKMMYLILGILVGAVITAGCFLVFSKNRGPEMGGGQMPDFSNMTDEEREEMMNNRGEGGFERPGENGSGMDSGAMTTNTTDGSATSEDATTSNNV